jgi:hypothetical protein
MNDTDRLNWLEQNQGAALVSDDDQHWAVVVNGFQDCPMETPADISTTFWIKKDDWKPTVREAIDAAIGLQNIDNFFEGYDK